MGLEQKEVWLNPFTNRTKTFFIFLGRSFVKGTMVKDVKKSMLVTRDEIHKIKNGNNKFMGALVNKIHDALNGKFTYKKK